MSGVPSWVAASHADPASRTEKYWEFLELPFGTEKQCAECSDMLKAGKLSYGRHPMHYQQCSINPYPVHYHQCLTCKYSICESCYWYHH